MRWTAGYEPDDASSLEQATIEAASSVEAVQRLREVAGTDTDVVYVVPDPAATSPTEDTYEDFLTDSGTADEAPPV